MLDDGDGKKSGGAVQWLFIYTFPTNCPDHEPTADILHWYSHIRTLPILINPSSSSGVCLFLTQKPVMHYTAAVK